MFPLWIRSHKDLPLKWPDGKYSDMRPNNRSFIRLEILFEAHTAHADGLATRQITEDCKATISWKNYVCLLSSKGPVWDISRRYTIGIDAVMPNGRTLQVASCHHYRDQWAKAFDITFENLNAEQQHVHQTTYGMSERLLGAVVGMHGDDNGLIMPPAIAPFQIVICPMIKKNSEVDTIGESHRIAKILREAGLRVKVDSRDIRAGQKYYDWEIKGVPLRLDIGPRDGSRNSLCCIENRW